MFSRAATIGLPAQLCLPGDLAGPPLERIGFFRRQTTEKEKMIPFVRALACSRNS